MCGVACCLCCVRCLLGLTDVAGMRSALAFVFCELWAFCVAVAVSVLSSVFFEDCRPARISLLALFQMKYGAMTVPRAWCVPVGSEWQAGRMRVQPG